MGDPKKQRRKYETPNHPWEKERIEFEKEILNKYGLKNKNEIWKIQSKLKNVTGQIKQIIAMPSETGEVLKQKLSQKLVALGLISEGSPIEDAMNLSLDNLMDRRLQSLVFKKGLAKTHKQARQFITHEHITIGGKVVTSPSYLVHIGEEASIAFHQHSLLQSADHPERVVKDAPIESKKPKKDSKDDKKKDKKEVTISEQSSKKPQAKPEKKDEKAKEKPKEVAA